MVDKVHVGSGFSVTDPHPGVQDENRDVGDQTGIKNRLIDGEPLMFVSVHVVEEKQQQDDPDEVDFRIQVIHHISSSALAVITVLF